jgi:hypothetical protein
MDDRRFDNAVRSLARHPSRRALLRALLGGSLALLAARLRLPGAAARHRHVAQGDACVDDSQCDPWLVCAWNGFGSAGAACCASVGGGCDDDFGCCGSPTCFGGVCTDVSAAPAPGEPCQLGGNTCVYAAGAFACDYVAWTNDYRCCAYAGDRCGWNGECCGSNSCVGGVCSNVSAAPAPGEPCQTTDQCRRPQTGAICEYTVSTQDTRCCWYEGFCSSGAQCCGSRVCAGGVCQFPAGGSNVDTTGAVGEWCGNKYCETWQWCCNASCGVCMAGQGACTDDVCVACPGCDSGLCFSNGYCAQ